MTPPVERVVAALREHGCKPKGGGGQWSARCPAHPDQNPSLSVSEGPGGIALVCCHAECEPEAIVAAIGLAMSDLFPRPNGEDGCNGAPSASPTRKQPPAFSSADSAERFLTSRLGQPAGRWSYTDATGAEVGRIYRFSADGGKTYRQMSLVDGGWAAKAMPAPRPLYRLDIVLAAPATIVVVEGEKCAHALIDLGIPATTSAGGANAGAKTDWTPVAVLRVVVIPDNDEPGARYASEVAAAVRAANRGASVGIVELPGLPKGGDIVDFIAALRTAGRTDDEIRRDVLARVDAAAPFAPSTPPDVERSEAWGRLVPLEDPPLPAFPVELLDPELREFIEAGGVAYQVPVDMVAMFALAMIAAVVAKKVRLHIRGDWTEALTLYVVVAMLPGERKSSVLALLYGPIDAWEAEQSAAIAPAEKAARDALDAATAVVRTLQGQLARGKPADRARVKDELAAAIRARDEIKIPLAPRIRADDVTPEELGRLIAQNGGRLAVISSEGGFFEIIAGRYSDGTANLDLVLKGWDGRESWRRDRVSDSPLRVREPILTCGFIVQPDVVASLARKDGFRGRGFIARYLFSLPTSLVGERNSDPPPVPPQLVAHWNERLRELLNWPTEFDEFGELRSVQIALDETARGAMVGFLKEMEPRLGPNGDLHFMADWASKLSGTVARIAGLLHVYRHGIDPVAKVGVDTVTSAIGIGRYLIEHARAAFELMQRDPTIAQAQQIVRWIRRKGLREFSQRDALDALRREVRRMDAVEKALAVLQERGYVRPKQPDRPGGRGRPPSPVWEVNPEVLRSPKPTAETAEPVGVGEPVSSADSADDFRDLPTSTGRREPLPPGIDDSAAADGEEDAEWTA